MFLKSIPEKIHLSKEEKLSTDLYASLDKEIREKYPNTGSNRIKNYEELSKLFAKYHTEALRLKDPNCEPAIYLNVLNKYMKEFDFS